MVDSVVVLGVVEVEVDVVDSSVVVDVVDSSVVVDVVDSSVVVDVVDSSVVVDVVDSVDDVVDDVMFVTPIVVTIKNKVFRNYQNISHNIKKTTFKSS